LCVDGVFDGMLASAGAVGDDVCMSATFIGGWCGYVQRAASSGAVVAKNGDKAVASGVAGWAREMCYSARSGGRGKWPVRARGRSERGWRDGVWSAALLFLLCSWGGDKGLGQVLGDKTVLALASLLSRVSE
jgi:hypothetical protein